MRTAKTVPLDFPVALRLHGKPVLVVGAGRIAEGRIRQLLEVGAQVHVISPEAAESVKELALSGELRWSARSFATGDCAGAFLVFTAASDPEVNRLVVEEARARGILVNAADEPPGCDFFMPSIGRRGPVTVAVSTSGQAPSLSRALRERAMAAIGPEYGRLARLMGRIRNIVPAGAERTRALNELAHSEVAALWRKGDRGAVFSVLRRLLSEPEALTARSSPGTVFLVGAGPGDPSLLTLRAAQLLSEADTVVYDRLVHPNVLRHVRSGARLIFAGKEGGGAQITQEEINATLISQARLGRRVVRLKGGDPFVFGRGGEEALALVQARVPFEVVPGVSSGVAAPAAAGIPVTHRGLSAAVTFATAHSAKDEPDWDHLARSPTLVLFMGGQRLSETTAALQRAGRAASTPAAIIEAGTWERQRVVEGTLLDIAQRAASANVGSPALLVIGEVAALRGELAGAEELQQRRVSP